MEKMLKNELENRESIPFLLCGAVLFAVGVNGGDGNGAGYRVAFVYQPFVRNLRARLEFAVSRPVFSLTYIFRRRYTKYPLLSMIAASETEPTIKRFTRKGLTLISPFFFFLFFFHETCKPVSSKNLYGRTFRVSKI